MIAKTLLKLNRTGRRAVQVRRYENSKLNVPEIRKQFQLELKNRFSCLVIEDDSDENRQEDEGKIACDNEVEKKWKKIKDTYCETAKDVLGYGTRKNKSWISPESWKGVEERKQLKQKLAGTRSGKAATGIQDERSRSEEKFEKGQERVG